MSSTRYTENDRLRHQLDQKAKQRATANLRERYPEVFQGMRDAELVADPDAPRSRTYRRAEAKLRRKFIAEFNTYFAIHQNSLHRQYGYRPASTKRNDWNADVVKAVQRLVEYVREEHLDGTAAQLCQCGVCDALATVDTLSHGG